MSDRMMIDILAVALLLNCIGDAWALQQQADMVDRLLDQIRQLADICAAGCK